MNFDGKVYLDEGPGDSKVRSTFGKRVNARILELDGQVNGKPDDKEEFKLSEDGKTLTLVSKPVNSSDVFTSAWGGNEKWYQREIMRTDVMQSLLGLKETFLPASTRVTAAKPSRDCSENCKCGSQP
jgi:hypothetical protein